MTGFMERLAQTMRERESLVCVGLDPRPDPATPEGADAADAARALCIQAVEATKDLACAYKPNSAYFEALGAEGWQALADVIRAAGTHAPVILDAKRGDIGASAEAYAKAAFHVLGADAITVNPYMGGDCVEAFTRHADRGVFLLCRTSNPGAQDLEELKVGERPLYEHVAEKALAWNGNGNVGLVVGATAPAQLSRVRRIVGEGIPLLVPGVGAQGGRAEDVMRHGADARGGGVLVNASRGILYAGEGRPGDQRAACDALRRELNAHRTPAPA